MIVVLYYNYVEVGFTYKSGLYICIWGVLFIEFMDDICFYNASLTILLSKLFC